MKKIAIFASGNGSNAQRIAEYFNDNEDVEISMILSNNKNAFVLERANNLNIASFVFTRDDLYQSDKIIRILEEKSIDLIVLAGFLWLVPANLIKAFPNRIINIHPALLPKYGGKGFYGSRVHEAVLKNNDKESGISIHYVNEKYDDGQIIFQAKCPVEKNDTSESLAHKIHQLEYKYYPGVIENLLLADYQ